MPGFRIIRPLAAGGMGAVYEAERRSTHERFAIKFILGHLDADPQYLARFGREIAALRSIRHPNVVNVFEWRLPAADADDPPYLVMEFLRGEALHTMLRREETVAPPLAVRIMLQVLDGLAAAHAVGVIHRDLGPTNVFLVPEPDGRLHVKVLDFGLARPLEPDGGAGLTQVGTWMGKPAYVAPESLRNAPLDQRSDLFACGIVLYRMLAGRLPYVATSGNDLWGERYAQRRGPPEYPSPRTFAPAIPAALDAIVARAIRKDPEDRYASAREMQDDLLRFEDDGVDRSIPVTAEALRPPADRSATSVLGAPATFVERRLSRPRFRRSAIAAIVVLAGLVAATLLLWNRSEVLPSPSPTNRASAPRAAGAADQVPSATAASGRPTAGSPVSTAAGAGLEAGTATPSAAAAEPAPDAAFESTTVRIRFDPFPRGAVATVDGRTVPPSGLIEVARSEKPLEASVTFPDGRYQRYDAEVFPSEDRVVHVRLRSSRPPSSIAAETEASAPVPAAAAGQPDAGTTAVGGRFGTVFAGGYDEAP